MQQGIAVDAAQGILLSCDRLKLAEFGGPITLNRFWAYSLLKRMSFVAKRKHAVAESECLKGEFLLEVVTTVETEKNLF